MLHTFAEQLNKKQEICTEITVPNSAVRKEEEHFLFVVGSFTSVGNQVPQYESMRLTLDPMLGHTIHYGGRAHSKGRITEDRKIVKIFPLYI